MGLAFTQFLGLVIFKVLLIFKYKEKLNTCLRKRKNSEDDWEPYEEAAERSRVRKCLRRRTRD